MFSQYYIYDLPAAEIFIEINKIASESLESSTSTQQLLEHCSYLASLPVGVEYSNSMTQLHLTALIHLINSYHDLFLLNSFSTLSDVESIFVLPYKIDRQKYDFEEKVKDALAQSLYQYQLTLSTQFLQDPATIQLISKNTFVIFIDDIKLIEKDLKANISKMPEDYESQRPKVKNLLIKLTEVYKDNIDNGGLSELAHNIYMSLRGQNDEFNYAEAHHKIRSVVNVCVYLYRTFYKEFGYLIGPFVLTTLNLINDLSESLIVSERLAHSQDGEKLHRKILNYPDLIENPLSMLKHANSRTQIDAIIESMHHKIQDLVRLEVGARRDKDLETQEKDDLQGLFKIPITPQIEHLMKISKSIFDKTKADKEREEEMEREEIAQNFPTYHEEFDRDRLFERNETQNVDYEEPVDEPNIMTFNSFRNIEEKKKCFHKLIKTYKALLQKRDSILAKNSDITTMSKSAIFTEKLKEISTYLGSIFCKQAAEQIENSLTPSERKLLYLNIKKCFEALIEESKMSETKITLQVTSKDFPENYNFYEDPYFTEIKLVYAPMIKIIH